MDIEKFKLELILKGYKLECKLFGPVSNNKYFARIVHAEYRTHLDNYTIPNELKSDGDKWKYFTWGKSEQETIEEVYRQWISKKKF